MEFLDNLIKIVFGLAGWGFAFLAGTINGVMSIDECFQKDSGMRMCMWILGSCSAVHAILMAIL